MREVAVGKNCSFEEDLMHFSHRVLMIYNLVIDFLKIFASGRSSDIIRPL